jgi:hypothetical protein
MDYREIPGRLGVFAVIETLSGEEYMRGHRGIGRSMKEVKNWLPRQHQRMKKLRGE